MEGLGGPGRSGEIHGQLTGPMSSGSVGLEDRSTLQHGVYLLALSPSWGIPGTSVAPTITHLQKLQLLSPASPFLASNDSHPSSSMESRLCPLSADLSSLSRKASPLLRNTCVKADGSPPDENRDHISHFFYTKASTLH